MVSLADRGHQSDREGTGEGRQDGVRIEGDHLRGKVRRAGTGNPENQTRPTGHGIGTQVRAVKSPNFVTIFA